IFTVPLQDSPQLIPQRKSCSTKCETFPRKLFGGFEIGKSYEFLYKGRSHVDFKGVSPPAHSFLDLEAEVMLSFYGPCDVSLQIKKPLINGVQNKEMEELLTKYPLMAGVSNGMVKDVCAHPDDEAVSLNLKKGILSTMQNSMPHWPENIDATISETDVLGTCPTIYRSSLSLKDNIFNVSKSKFHEQCTGQHTRDDESPLTSLMFALSLVTVSTSDCYQSYDADDILLKSAGCVDVNIIQVDDAKTIHTTQNHSIKFQKELPANIVPVILKFRRTDLIFELLPDPMSDLLLPVVKKQLKQLCDEIQGDVNENAAVTYSELISNLNRIPKNEIKQLLVDIKARKFCSNYERLEDLYLDALPLLNNAGSVEVMVDQVLSGKVKGGRTFLYTIALHLIKNPSTDSVKAVSPLLESKSAPSSMVLAAGSLIRKYCKVNSNCLQEKDVREILQKLADRIASTCTSSSKNDNEKRHQILTLLKSIGNIGKISKPLEESILKCLSSEESDTFVRVSAAQAFRQSSCEIKPTGKLFDLALNPIGDTEVRIASYLVAVTCTSFEQATLLVSKMENEPNKQVQSFILSHLHSLQKSDAPYLRGLRYNLTSLSVPFVYNKDILNLSRSIDMSYYLPTLGVGAGMESSVIYSPESSFPRQASTNYTLNLFDNVFNIGEISLRMKDLETLVVKMIMKGFKKHNGVDLSLPELLKALNMNPKSKLELPKLDAFVRLFGQEVGFMSVTPSEKDLDYDQILDKIMKLLDKIFLNLEGKTSTARGGQLRLNQFVPTSQGIPLQMKAVLITILTFDNENKARLSPAASFYTNVFVGYNLGAKTGFRIRIKGSVTPHALSSIQFSRENLKIILDIPKKVRFIDAHYNCTMMNKLPGDKNDEELYPQQGYPVYTIDKCDKSEVTRLNLVICTHYKSPDYKKVKFFPFGAIDFSMDLSKPKADKEVMKIMVNTKNEKTEKSLDLKVEAPGTKNPNLVEVSLLYKTNSNGKSILGFVRGPNKKGKALQVNLKQRRYATGSQHNVMVYFSNKKQVSSSDQVMFLKLKESQKGKIRKEFHLNTKNKLAKYVDTNIIVDFNTDSSPYVSKSNLEINKFEFSLTIPEKFNTTHYIRKTPAASGDRLVYDIYSLSKTPSSEFLKISGNYSSEGKYSEMTRSSQATISLKVLDSEFSLVSQHSFTHKKRQFLYSLKKPDEEKPLFLTEAAFIQVPSSPSSYGLYAQENGNILLKAEGNVDTDASPYQFKQRTDIKIENIRYSNEYEVKYQLFVTDDTKDAWIVLSSYGFPFFTAEVEFISEKDLFGVQTVLGAYTRDPDNKNLLKVKVIMPNGKEFVFHSECLHIKNTVYRSTHHSILVQTASGERHELKSNYKYDFSEAPVKMMIEGRTEIESPVVKKIIIIIDTAVDINEAFQKGHYKMEIESEKISFPIKTNLEFTNQEKELKAKALIDLGSSSNLKINGETQMTRNDERKIRDASVQFSVDLPHSKNYNLSVKKDVKSLILDLSFNGKVIIVLEQASPKDGVWFAKLTTPLRRTEAHSTISSDAIILSLFPNRITSEDKYEAEGHFRKKESSLDTFARLQYPRRENDMRVQMNIAMKDQTSTEGKVEIDIFETPQDKIVIDIRTQKSINNNFKLEADIKIPVKASLSEAEKYLDIFLRKSASDEPKISYVMRVNHPTMKTSMVYSKLSTPKESIEMISEVKQHDLLQCIGNTMNGTVASTKHGSFDFKSAVCAPGYIEFGAKKPSEDKIYMAKVGMKRPNAAKVAIDLVFDSSDAITAENFWLMESTINLYGEHKYLPKRPVVLVGAKLWRSRFVTLDASYNSKGMKDHYETIIKPAYKGLKNLALDLSKELPEEIRENILVKLPNLAVQLTAELQNLKEKLSQELSVVLKELGLTLPNLQELQDKMEVALQKLEDTYQKFIEKTDEFLNSFGIRTGIEKILHIYHRFNEMIQNAIEKAAKQIRKVIDNIIEGNLEEVPGTKWLSRKLGFNFWDWIKEKWSNIKNSFINKFNSIKKFIHHYAHVIKHSIKKLYHKLLHIPLIKKFAKWVESWFNWDNWWDNKYLYRFASKYLCFSVTPESGQIRLQVPVKKPVSSLAVALRNVGLAAPQHHGSSYTKKYSKK
ncbi:Vitellogenin, partial [Armadillidium nasatum]